MAGSMQISIRDEDTAKSWLRELEALNQDYFTAMKDAGDTLKDMANFCDGTLVDEYVKLADSVMNAAQTTFEAISTISDTVNTVLGKVKEFAGSAVAAIAQAAVKSFGS